MKLCAVELKAHVLLLPDQMQQPHSYETRVTRSVAAEDSKFLFSWIFVAVEISKDVSKRPGRFNVKTNVVRNLGTPDLILFPSS